MKYIKVALSIDDRGRDLREFKIQKWMLWAVAIWMLPEAYSGLHYLIHDLIWLFSK